MRLVTNHNNTLRLILSATLSLSHSHTHTHTRIGTHSLSLCVFFRKYPFHFPWVLLLLMNLSWERDWLLDSVEFLQDEFFCVFSGDKTPKRQSAKCGNLILSHFFGWCSTLRDKVHRLKSITYLSEQKANNSLRIEPLDCQGTTINRTCRFNL